jgi:hypothetical protein
MLKKRDVLQRITPQRELRPARGAVSVVLRSDAWQTVSGGIDAAAAERRMQPIHIELRRQI